MFSMTTYLVAALLLCLIRPMSGGGPAASSSSTIPSFIKVEPLQDWRLCNNGKTQNIFYGNPDRKCMYRNGPEPCFGERPVYNATTCRQAMLDLFSNQHDPLHKLKSLFDVADRDISLKRLTLFFPREHYHYVADEVDNLLTPRLWWHIEKENFPWQLEDRIFVVFDRIEENREKFMKWQSDLQYPSASVCQQTPMWVGNMLGIHPGVATAIAMCTV